MTPETELLAQKLRTLEVRVAMAEDDIRILRRSQGWAGLTTSERQIVSIMLVLGIMALILRGRHRAAV